MFALSKIKCDWICRPWPFHTRVLIIFAMTKMDKLLKNMFGAIMIGYDTKPNTDIIPCCYWGIKGTHLKDRWERNSALVKSCEMMEDPLFRESRRISVWTAYMPRVSIAHEGWRVGLRKKDAIRTVYFCRTSIRTCLAFVQFPIPKPWFCQRVSWVTITANTFVQPCPHVTWVCLLLVYDKPASCNLLLLDHVQNRPNGYKICDDVVT